MGLRGMRIAQMPVPLVARFQPPRHMACGGARAGRVIPPTLFCGGLLTHGFASRLFRDDLRVGCASVLGLGAGPGFGFTKSFKSRAGIDQ